MDKLGPIVLGAGSFNTIYNKDPALNDVDKVLRYAFENGVTTIDTAAYYGPSEDIVGAALKKLRDEYPRQSYMICTKAGRWEDNRFDYSAKSIRDSLARSLKRLDTSYVDVLYIHDVEFMTDKECLEAISTAFQLKKEGLTRFVGFSGYPVEHLCYIGELVREKLGESVDAVLSYCNLTLQNDLLLKFEQRLKKQSGVKVVLNASPLSMSLLRNGPIHDFHPGTEELKIKAAKIAAELKEKDNLELADVAEQYAFAKWSSSPTVIGMRTIPEIRAAIENRQKALSSPTPKLWQDIIDEFGPELHNYTWPSGRH